MKGAGYDMEQLLKRPLIAIANSHTEMTAAHNHLRSLRGPCVS
jgi:dihydroxyacid dehydratase/phosphogluconate dehydratase